MTAAEMPMTAGAAEEVLPLAGEEGALSALVSAWRWVSPSASVWAPSSESASGSESA